MICSATLLLARKTKTIEKDYESYMYTFATMNASMNCLLLFTYVCSYVYSILLYIPCLYLCFCRLLNVCSCFNNFSFLYYLFPRFCQLRYCREIFVSRSCHCNLMQFNLLLLCGVCMSSLFLLL